MGWIKKHLFSVLFIAMFIIGLSLLLYPVISNYWNSFHQTQAIARYESEVAGLDEAAYETFLEQAREYNEGLTDKENRWILTEEEEAEYNQLFNVGGNGVMGYIEIPSIDVALPIYHGTDDGILQIAVGHLEGSSLPTGGAGTHCVISGHRGLPSATLFTHLDQLAEGDVFTIRVLNQGMTYEVDQVRIVEPDDLSCLEIEEGQDLCTLITCTPYGVNTHRLLVRGHRIESADSEIYVPANAAQIDSLLVASVIAAPILAILLIAVLCSSGKKGKYRADGKTGKETEKEAGNETGKKPEMKY